jgi:multicomponent Na+:H+ antiporter subunit D
MSNSLPALILFSSLLPGLLIFLLGERNHLLRVLLNLTGAAIKLLLVGLLIMGVASDKQYESRLTLLPGMDLVLNADALSVLFVTLSSVLWFVTTIYAVGYLEGSPHRSRFFGFFSLCVSATMGIAMAGNMLTFLIFYELLTLVTYPLVVHRGTAESLKAGRVYLIYTLAGGALLLLGVAWLRAVAGPLDFTETGVLAARGDLDPIVLSMIFALLIAGLGVKAALVPFHGWLPKAMVAPAPVSALLHAVAVVKAGAFGIVRVVYDVYGIEFTAQLGLLPALAVVAAITIIYGSIRALYQDELKKRLAYSTVSQVSYIALGAALFGPTASIGGIVHLVHQGIMKITLFFCAGNLAEEQGIHHVHQMNGIARRMPLTMTAFTIASLGMIGVPPLAGFFSKWYLGSGGLEAGHSWVIAVLVLSSLLNAGYFLPILYRAWLLPPDDSGSERQPGRGYFEIHWMLLLPPVITASLVVVVGLLANAPFSPLEWTRLIVSREYDQ